jgi:hypothetical protein
MTTGPEEDARACLQLACRILQETLDACPCGGEVASDEELGTGARYYSAEDLEAEGLGTGARYNSAEDFEGEGLGTGARYYSAEDFEGEGLGTGACNYSAEDFEGEELGTGASYRAEELEEEPQAGASGGAVLAKEDRQAARAYCEALRSEVTAQHSTVSRHGTAQHSTAQHSTAQHSTAQHSTAQHSTAQHSTAQHSTAQHSTALVSRLDNRARAQLVVMFSMLRCMLGVGARAETACNLQSSYCWGGLTLHYLNAEGSLHPTGCPPCVVASMAASPSVALAMSLPQMCTACRVNLIGPVPAVMQQLRYSLPFWCDRFAHLAACRWSSASKGGSCSPSSACRNHTPSST